MSVHAGGRGPGHLARSGAAFYPDATVALDFLLQDYRVGSGGWYVRDPSLLTGWSFSRASTKTALNSSGAVVSFGSGVPAITDLGLLVEAASTNLLLQSQFASGWAATNSTLTPNATAAPDGTLTAASLLETAVTGQHPIQQTVSKTTSSLVYTVSQFVKANGRNFVEVQLASASGGAYVYVNLTTGAMPTGPAVFGTNWSGATATVTALANGWFRIALSATNVTDTTILAKVFPSIDGAVDSYAGDITKGLYLWGAQLEQASAASSYIPTTSASVTRAADVASIGGLTFPVTGTVLADYVMPKQPAASRGYVWDVTDAGNSRFTERGADVGDPQPSVALGNGTAVVSLSPYTGVTGQTIKTAFAYDTSAARAGFSVNGVDTTSATQAVAATLTGATLGLGNSSVSINQLNGYLKRFVIVQSFYSSAQRIAATQ